MPPYMFGVMTHGLTGYARAEQLGLAVGMTKPEIQKLFAIQLAHHASHFPIGMMAEAGVRPDFQAMVRAGQLTAADGAALTELYESMLSFVAGGEGAATAADVQAAVRAPPPEMRVQLLSDDLAQFADPRGIGKWVGIGWGALANQGVQPITMRDVIQASFADPAFSYAFYNLARDPASPFLERSSPLLSKFGITLSSGPEGLVVGLNGDSAKLAEALRSHPKIIAELKLHPALDDAALAGQFFARTPWRRGNGEPSIIGGEDRGPPMQAIYGAVTQPINRPDFRAMSGAVAQPPPEFQPIYGAIAQPPPELQPGPTQPPFFPWLPVLLPKPQRRLCR